MVRYWITGPVVWGSNHSDLTYEEHCSLLFGRECHSLKVVSCLHLKLRDFGVNERDRHLIRNFVKIAGSVIKVGALASSRNHQGSSNLLISTDRFLDGLLLLVLDDIGIHGVLIWIHWDPQGWNNRDSLDLTGLLRSIADSFLDTRVLFQVSLLFLDLV